MKHSLNSHHCFVGNCTLSVMQLKLPFKSMRSVFNVFESESLFCSSGLFLFDQKYSKK